MARNFSVLIVDDDSLIHQSFRLCLPPHWRVVSALSPEDIPDASSFHAAFVDMHYSRPSGATESRSSTLGPQLLGPQIIEGFQKSRPTTQVIAMSGDLDRTLMEKCLLAGAHKFLAKPLHTEEVLSLLKKIEAEWDLRQTTHTGDKPRWIGASPPSQTLIKQIAALKGESRHVLIEGETGAGKEVVARLLHHQEDAERPLVAVNVGAIAENLFESEFFGHVKGAFTGAERDRAGFAELADGGDLFLDEIEALPLAQQVKLLRFLESGEIRRVGGKETLRLRVRVLAAGNQPLAELVKQGPFREDLYQRLTAQRIHVPPLKERANDIPDLCTYFLEQDRPRRNKKMSDDALAALKAYSWPGNVRELKRVCEQLSLTSPLPIIRAQEVDGLLKQNAAPESADLRRGLNLLVSDYEKELIRRGLNLHKNDVEATANLFGVSRSTLYKKIKDYGLETE